MSSRVLTCGGKVLRIPTSPATVLRADPATLPSECYMNLPNVGWFYGSPPVFNTPRGMPCIGIGTHKATLVTDPTGAQFPHYAFDASPVWPDPPDYSYPNFVGTPSGAVFLYAEAATLKWKVHFHFSWNIAYGFDIHFERTTSSTDLSPAGDYTYLSHGGYFTGPSSVAGPHTITL